MSTTDTTPPRRRTLAERRAATRLALLDAAVDCLIEEGYANLSTRRVAERAGVAQSTQMHHFPSREAFLVEALGHVARRMADEALELVGPADLRDPEARATMLDQAWRAMSSPVARAATELWVAAYNEPELAEAMRRLEGDVAAIVAGAAATALPAESADPRFLVLLDATFALVRGLALTLPVSGHDEVQARWDAIRPLILEIGASILDEPRPD